MSGFLYALDRVATSSLTRAVLSAWRGLLDLLLPNPCALCVWSDAVAHQLCEPCTKLLKQQTKQIFQAQDFADALPLDLVTGQPLKVFAASFYTPEMAKVLLNFKDHQGITLADFLRPITYRTLQHAAETVGYPYYRLVPIPASGASLRKRGYNPVALMLPRQLPPVLRWDPKLLKIRWQAFNRAAHHGTGVQGRREQSRKKFRLATSSPEPAEPIILLDDVLTTGATLAAAVRTLESQGFDVVAAVVFSAVMPRG